MEAIDLKYALATNGIRFLCAIWWLWRARNKDCLEHGKMQVPTIISNIVSLEEASLAAYPSSKPQANLCLVSWSPPHQNCVAINVDGSSFGNPGRAGFGGCMRNHLGNWLLGFSGYYGYGDNLHMELLAIMHGLDIAWSHGFRTVDCRSDSMEALSLIKVIPSNFHRHASIIWAIRELVVRNWKVEFSHTLREGNQCADFLAKTGARNEEALIVLRDPPSGLSTQLLADAMGVCFPRG